MTMANAATWAEVVVRYGNALFILNDDPLIVGMFFYHSTAVH